MDYAAAAASAKVGLNSSHGELLGGPRNADTRMLLRIWPAAASSRVRSAAVTVQSAKKAPEEWNYPWPKQITKDMQKDALKLLQSYKPLPVKPKIVALPFEKPVFDLQEQISAVRDSAYRTGMDFSAELQMLEQKMDDLRKDLYKNLTPLQRLQLARHPNRPTCYDHILNMTDKWLELHGDREGHDDPAIVSGIGKMEGMSFMFIGHQKGRNTKENIYRNFAMPQPWGYRKALRMMKHAAHHGFPILTFIDTPGAYAGVEAEEAGQGEAIATNLKEMFGFDVPMIATVIGEGGSGGALAVGCTNKMLMMENSVYYVASPEACAAILWKSAEASPKAAEALRITPTDLVKFKIVDEIIPEPLGGAQYDPEAASQSIKQVILRHMEDLLKMDAKHIKHQRYMKYRSIGEFSEGVEIDAYEKRNMKPRDTPVSDEQLLLSAVAPAGAALTNGTASGAVRVDGFSMKSVEFVTKSV